MRIATWVAFAVCVVFALYAATLPALYYLAGEEQAPRGDYAIGWVWMTAFGTIPAAVLLALVFMQRREVPRWLSVLWLTPAIPVLASVTVLALLARAA